MEKLAYNVQKGTETAGDYIAWAQRRLQVGNESAALLKLSANDGRDRSSSTSKKRSSRQVLNRRPLPQIRCLVLAHQALY